ncbi:hypothetical protein FACS1894216_12040 [Synergistales bacterium]|nr:hypothetical protein FACS1894216_12040 [Synergistales bacterium]
MSAISNTPAIMTAGMKCLRDSLGVVEAEIFIANIKQEHFDYTEWRRDNLWTDMTLDEILTQAAARDPIGKSFGLED